MYGHAANRHTYASAILLPLGVATVPIATGIAILRYRLFDIEVIIRRTLVYSLLTLTLGLVYVGCILLSRTPCRATHTRLGAGDRGAVPTVTPPHPESNRQALLPPQVRRRRSAGGLRRNRA
jgi:hypothetical protein